MLSVVIGFVGVGVGGRGVVTVGVGDNSVFCFFWPLSRMKPTPYIYGGFHCFCCCVGQFVLSLCVVGVGVFIVVELILMCCWVF